MSDRVAASLSRMFEEERLVFWYDADRDMRETFEALVLEGVEKVEIDNNEFGLKYRILRQEPDQKFLIYKHGPEPKMQDNWLLDVQLATAVFKADQAAIWVQELGIPTQYDAAVRDHMEFYRSQKRLDRLKKFEADKPSAGVSEIRRKMLAVCVGADGDLDTVVEALLEDLAQGKDAHLRLIERSGLTEFLWKQIANAYGYQADDPDFEDFAIALFQSAYHRALGDAGQLNAEALLTFRRWKNSRHNGEAFEVLSARYQDILNVPEDLEERDARTVVAIDHFEEIDRHVIRSLVTAMSEQTVSSADVLNWVRERRQSHWYPRYKHIYQAIACATEFQQALSSANLGMTSAADGLKRYIGSWYKLDQFYRKFIYHMQASAQPSLLSSLYDNIENRYSNSFVLKVNDLWQDQIAGLAEWQFPGYERQQDFYLNQAAEYRRRDQKVVVIISDALRYEVAEECLREIRKLNRFDADLKPMISALPSYTQLGMASLLPNKSLEILEKGSEVTSFGQSTAGTANRAKILANGRDGDHTKAMKAEDFMNLKGAEGKELFRDNHVVYIYHNRIDAVGDKLQTEDRLPEATEDAVADLIKMVQKLTSANFSNIMITADHGFLYQHRPLDESSFSVAEPAGEEVLVKNRRFVVGRGLKEAAGLKLWKADQLGLRGNLDVSIPNSVNRLRVKGSGARFVHGGASLQEIVVPVLRVGKQREADVSKVDVQIVVAGKSLISSGQTAVMLYQIQPVSEKQHARQLTAGIYASDEELISDLHDVTFDFSSENAREREMPLKFLLSRAADEYNNQDVFLKLKEQIGKTSHSEEIASHRFQLKRGIKTDFDF
ncbi:BREX-1 system phosphatase PglZ type A [Aliiroseovarius sp. 2305UL8-7]|uniref:BREX-1 system phosphatase PglZ type A n=1 Tax=Aliiroseovarius conchicola TaxID=3121637 RepID=UPI0035284B66